MGFFGVGDLVLWGLGSGTTAAIAVAGAAALTGMYLLRLRRRRVVVAFAPLWLQHAGERRSEVWARRLRRWLSLAVQLAIFALILLAAADPRPAAADRAGRSLVVLIDRSASMSATDEPEGRLAAARARALALTDGLGPADRALVASFAAGVTAESGFEPDGPRLARAIAGVTPSEEPADLPRALAFATAVLRGRAHPVIVIVGDGAYSDDARAQAAAVIGGGTGGGRVDVRFAPVGRRARNVAILGFAARRYPADPGSVEAALTLQNFGAAPADVTLEITAGSDADRAAIERVHFSLAPGERRRHLVPDVATGDARLEARLSVPGGDDLAVDDRAFAVVPPRPRLRVLRVGGSNLYLDGALLSLADAVTVTRARPAAAEATRADWAKYDVVILDGVAPGAAPTEGHFLYLDPRGPGSPFPDRGVVREPVLADVRRGHPLVRQLDLRDVNIAEARRLVAAPGDVAVASAFGAPLLLARERPGLRVAALAFDVRRSDLPMRAAFPLLVANALTWLGGVAPEARDAGGLAVTTGATARLPAPRGTGVLDVEDPTGARARWPVAGESAEIPITRVGFYRAGGLTVAANLADAVESNTAPVATLALGGRTLAPPDPPAPRRGRPLAAMALIAAAALLAIEWWSYHRRWTV